LPYVLYGSLWSLEKSLYALSVNIRLKVMTLYESNAQPEASRVLSIGQAVAHPIWQPQVAFHRMVSYIWVLALCLQALQELAMVLALKMLRDQSL
jgi:hypothetical protein